jgi:hypothetical protein
MNRLGIGGYFTFECYDHAGRLKWRDVAKNGVTNAGLNSLLDIYLGATAKVATWYCGLIDGSGYSALAAADTSASHAGWTESADYGEAVRQTWTPGAASSQSVVNGTAMTFTINATKTIKGAFLISVSTKSGTTGTLFCTALFAEGDRSVVSTDLLKVTYTVSAVSA